MLRNIAKMIGWLVFLAAAISLFGWYGAIFFAVFAFLWNWIITVIYGEDDLTFLKALFTTNVLLPFTAYGKYCSPKYGVDGPTNNAEPIDALDDACRIHDNTMLLANAGLKLGSITRKEQQKLKLYGDIEFLKSALNSKNHASGIYLLGLTVGFSARVVVRYVIMLFK